MASLAQLRALYEQGQLKCKGCKAKIKAVAYVFPCGELPHMGRVTSPPPQPLPPCAPPLQTRVAPFSAAGHSYHVICHDNTANDPAATSDRVCNVCKVAEKRRQARQASRSGALECVPQCSSRGVHQLPAWPMHTHNMVAACTQQTPRIHFLRAGGASGSGGSGGGSQPPSTPNKAPKRKQSGTKDQTSAKKAKS